MACSQLFFLADILIILAKMGTHLLTIRSDYDKQIFF